MTTGRRQWLPAGQYEPAIALKYLFRSGRPRLTIYMVCRADLSTQANAGDVMRTYRNVSRMDNMAFLFVVIIAVVLAGVLLMIATETAGKSGKWGLNLNSVWDVVAGKGLLRKVTCPRCGREQEHRRKPVILSEFLRGGRTCPNCGASMD